MTFIERILFEISKKGITKNKLLSDLKINHNAFAKWSNPECMPNGTTVVKIADYFEVTTDYLLGRTDKQREIGGITVPLERMSFYNMISQLNDQQFQMVDDIVNSVLRGRGKQQ